MIHVVGMVVLFAMGWVTAAKQQRIALTIRAIIRAISDRQGKSGQSSGSPDVSLLIELVDFRRNFLPNGFPESQEDIERVLDLFLKC